MTHNTMPTTNRRIKVLIIDDSALARKILSDGFNKDPGIQVIGAARDPIIARDLIRDNPPDVIILDIEMPRMDGLTFLREYMPVRPIPTVVVSALTEKGKQITLDAFEAGAVDVVQKPIVGVVDAFPVLMADICARVHRAAHTNVSGYARQADFTPLWPNVAQPAPLPDSTDRIIAIGASAGGVKALSQVIPAFPAAAPGIVVVQHMPPGFTASFAQRLNDMSAMQVKEAEHGDRIRPGLALLAPGGNKHLEVRRSGGEYRLALVEGEKVSGHTPSVDVLFLSVARAAGRNAAAALLTGMGEDGAAGMLAIRQAGGRTLAQDERTCVVYGMPKAAWDLGAAEAQAPLHHIADRLLAALL